MACTKITYDTQRQAEQSAEYVSLKYDKPNYAYLCCYCQKWHLTTIPPNRQPHNEGAAIPSMARIGGTAQSQQTQLEREYWLKRTMPKRGTKEKVKKNRHKG